MGLINVSETFINAFDFSLCSYLITLVFRLTLGSLQKNLIFCVRDD
jgi:hypothetical protein